MTFTAPGPVSTLLFVLLVAGMICLLLAGVYLSTLRLGLSPLKKTATVAGLLMAWLVLFSAVVISGIMRSSPLPFLPLILITVLMVSAGCALSRAGGWLAKGLPLQVLVLFQGFRFPLELILHSWARQGSIPLTMTWDGCNFDIVTGILALIAIFPVGKRRWFAWVVNTVGFLLLLNILRVVVLSSPLPFAWDVAPPLQLMGYIPYALIGPVCLGSALAGHVILTRSLLLKR